MSISSAQFDYVRDLVRRKAAIVLEDSKQYLVETRLDALARTEGDSTVDALIERLQTRPFSGIEAKVIDALTTNETSFFRDLHPFEALRTHVIPELIQQKSATRRLNIWCAASSSGQEPYTIAMVLREHFPELASWNVNFVATDISNEMLARAEEGCFTQFEVNRGLPARLMTKYFSRIGTQWRVNEEIRRLVSFRKLNLIEPWTSLPKMDLIFLRNVLIYFDTSVKTQIIRAARRQLEPHGFLFLGSTETMISIDEDFERVMYGRSACYRPGT